MDSKDRPEPAVPAVPVRRTLPYPALMADGALLPAAAGTTTGTINIVQALLRVVAHHWWKILAIWAVLSVGLGYAVTMRIKPNYELFSLLRVEPAHKDLFGLGIEAEVFDHFLQTQVELIKSPTVLGAAKANPSVAKTTLFRESPDFEAELRQRIQASVVPGSYLIRVAMSSSQPDESAVVINAVVRAYIDVANQWSSTTNEHHIENLKSYKDELSRRVKAKEDEWLDLAKNANIDLIEPSAASGSALPRATPNRVSVDEYKHVRGQLFQIRMDLIEAEALFNSRKEELAAGASGTDPELLLQRRIDDELNRDPAIGALVSQLEQIRRKYEHAHRVARKVSDPATSEAVRMYHVLLEKLKKLRARKSEELAIRFRDHGEGDPLHELTQQIEEMKVKKANYETLLSQMDVTNRQQGTDSVRVALVCEDLASLRTMEQSVEKRIEQLKFDSRGDARIKEIDPARGKGTKLSDSRRKLWTVTPVGVLALVLGLFLFLEIRSGRVGDLDEVSRRVPVEVYPVPSLPGTRRTTDQRALRANEAQLQEFLQSLDHLRVSLWFGKEAAAGSGRCLAVTSAVGGEGKTTLSAHLAVCCAKAGISTLVIDADMRRAALSRMFEEEKSAGLSDVLKGDLPAEEAVIALRDGGFHLLPAGTPGQHPGWLFREDRIGQVLARYRQMFDLVIIDTPPVLPVPDALSLARWIDGSILVIRYDVSRFAMIDRARRRLISAGIPILKTVVNGVRSSRYGNGYGYGYSYNYGTGYGQRTAPDTAAEASPGEFGERTIATGPHESSTA